MRDAPAGSIRGKPWLAGLVPTLLLVACTRLWAGGTEPIPQIIALSDGQQLRFVGATWGTNSRPPRAGGDRSPESPGRSAPELRLRVWFELLSSNTPAAGKVLSIWPTLADENGASGGYIGNFSPETNGWFCATFTVVPKRSPAIECGLVERSGGRGTLRGRVRFSNPAFGSFPQWQPEALPIVKRTDEFEVQLLGVERNPQTRGVEFYGQVTPLGSSGRRWQLERGEWNDATGNFHSIQTMPEGTGRRGAQESLARFRSSPPACWPSEAACRLKLEFKLTAGYAASDLVTYSNVPVPEVGVEHATCLTNRIGGMDVVMRFVHQPDNTNTSRPPPSDLKAAIQVSVELLGGPPGAALDFVAVTTDAGESLPKLGEGHSASRLKKWLDFRSIPPGVKTLSVTCAVQKLRAVEFMVAPSSFRE